MLEKFYTDKFDKNTVIVSEHGNYDYETVKSYICSAVNILKNKKQNIIISDSDNFNFIIKFFAAIFAGKNIYLLSDLKKLSDIEFEYDIFNENEFEAGTNYIFPKIDEKHTIINFFTSGSSSKSKVIKKSLYNLIKEGEDLAQEFNITNDLTVMSTTTMCHLFGMTFHLMFPLCGNLKIYTPSIMYPDNINKENTVLVSTPAFLNTVEKHKIIFKTAPKYILTAGSKLNDNVFKYLQSQTNVIEIYGSTETGVIAHKEQYNTSLKLFNNVQIKINEDNVEITSPYVFEDTVKINDKVEINGRNIIIKNRTDRVLKIYDKRISAEELEIWLFKNDFVNESYIIKHGEKLACLCALTKKGQDFLIKNGMFKLKTVLKKHLKKHSEIIPQRWKFIDELPRVQTGKINKSLIEHIFDFTLSLPVVLDRKEEANKIEYDIFFYNSCNFFQGHFPDYKILPGVVQIYIAKEFANARFNLNLGEGQWKKIKFSNIIVPDKIIKLGLEKDEKQVMYKFFDEEKVYSSGVFMIDNVFKELQCS